jgi:iron complex outermembrane receptor protein
LANGEKTNDLLIFGLVARRWIGEHWQLFGNIENFTDVRQTRYESLVSGPYDTPQFTEVWAPLDGFYVNAGFKVML